MEVGGQLMGVRSLSTVWNKTRLIMLDGSTLNHRTVFCDLSSWLAVYPVKGSYPYGFL